ncbi:MAG: RlmE family RNA methyltransferase [Alphaproteobacteria bacterium]|jgi:23S rRNA (uridine2552-2'-O)-methyltransferase
MTEKKSGGKAGGGARAGGGGKSGGPRGLQKKVQVKTRAKRSISSARWLERQLNDPYVAAAKSDGYHSRAAYKLLQMQEDLDIFKPGMRVVDLGAAPGGWTQVVCEIVKPGQNGGKVVAIDYLEMKPVAEAEFFLMDFTDDEAPDVLKNAIGGKAHVVMSDMAPPTIGHKQTDHLRIMGLADMAYAFALEVLLPGGTFLAKVFQGGAEKDLLNQMKKDFTKVKHIKPPASRVDSSEMYVVAMGFRG